jgi:hypothetical protein
MAKEIQPAENEVVCTADSTATTSEQKELDHRTSNLESGPVSTLPPEFFQERKYKGWRWFFICVGFYTSSLLYGIDNTVTANVQGPIVATFGEVQNLFFVTIGFTLGGTAMNLVQGKLFAYFDPKYYFIWGFINFEAATALCAAAPSMNALIVGRVWAGYGGGGLFLA